MLMKLLPSLICAANVYFACTNLPYTELSLLQKSAFLGIAVLSVLFLNPLMGQWAALLLLLAYVICILWFSRQKLINCCLLLFGYGCLVMTDHLCMLAAEHLFGLTPAGIITSYYLPYCGINLILTFFITRLLGALIRKKQTLQQINFSAPYVLLMLLYLLLCTVIFIVNFSYGESLGYSNAMIRLNAFLFFSHFMITTVILILIVCSLRKEMLMQRQLQQYENIKEYTAKIEEMHQDMRMFKHNYVNLLSSIAGYIEENDLVRLREYFNQEILPATYEFSASSTKLDCLSNIGITGLKSLLSVKLIQAMNQGIHLELEAPDRIDSLPMELADAIALIGIYLDNAIEAARESRDKRMDLALIRNKEQIIFHLQNSLPPGKIPFKDIYREGYSTKAGGTGLGLPSAERILKKYKNIVHSSGIEHDMFVQILELFH